MGSWSHVSNLLRNTKIKSAKSEDTEMQTNRESLPCALLFPPRFFMKTGKLGEDQGYIKTLENLRGDVHNAAYETTMILNVAVDPVMMRVNADRFALQTFVRLFGFACFGWLGIARCRRSFRFRLFKPFLCVLLIGLTSLSLQARESKVERLYQEFLTADSNSSGFITFSRELSVPQSRRTAESKGNTNGASDSSVARSSGSNLWYYACGWVGMKYIIALSREKPLVKLSDIPYAQTLEGFDGTNYWELSLNFPTKSYLLEKTPGPRTPIDMHNNLTLIPKDEPLRERGKYVLDPMLSSILERIGECRRVCQFGFSYPLSKSPEISSNSLILRSAGLPTNMPNGIVVEVAGKMEHPDTLNYSAEPPKGLPPAYAVAVDYANDALVITRLSKRGHKVNEVSYRILAVDAPAPGGLAKMLSWAFYKEDAGDITAEIVTDGFTRKLDSETMRVGGITALPTPIVKKPASLIYVAIMLGVTVLGGLLLINYNKKRRFEKKG